MLKIAPVPHSWTLQSSCWHCRVFSGSVCKNETDIITHPDLKIHILWLGLLLTNDTGALYITHRNWELTSCSAVHFYQDSMAPTSKHCNLCFIGGVCCRKSTQWILVFVFCRYQLHAHWHGYFGQGIPGRENRSIFRHFLATPLTTICLKLIILRTKYN